MTDKKTTLIEEIKGRFEKKFGKNDEIKRVIDEEVALLNAKQRLTILELENAENQILQRILALSQKYSIQTKIPQRACNSRNESRKPSQNEENLYDPQMKRINKLSPLSSNDQILQNVFPFTAKILKQTGIDKILKPSHTVQLESNLDLLGNYQRSETEKSEIEHTNLNAQMKRIQKREAKIKSLQVDNDIWKKIQDVQQKEFQKEIEREKKSAKQHQIDMANFYDLQIKLKKTKELGEKTRDKDIIDKLITKEKLDKLTEEEKQKSHQKFIHDQEKLNISFAKEYCLKQKEEIEQKKVTDANEMNKKVQEYQREQKEQNRAKSENRRQYCKWQEEISNARKKAIEDERNRSKIEGEKYIQHIESEMKKDEDEVFEFYSKIRNKTLSQIAPLPKKHFDNLRRFRQIEPESEAKGLKFIMSEERSPEGQRKQKYMTRDMLKKILNKQLQEKQKNDTINKSYIESQADFWKQEEKEMMMRDKLETMGEKLKKMIQRKDLDEHIKIKNQNQRFYEPTEFLMNKHLLSKAGFLPKVESNNSFTTQQQ